jgi:hypothetical protein
MLAPPLRLPCADPCWHSKAVSATGKKTPHFFDRARFLDRWNARQPKRVVSEPRHALHQFFSRRGALMSIQSRHWLDYDPVALVVLLVGMSAVALLALSI